MESQSLINVSGGAHAVRTLLSNQSKVYHQVTAHLIMEVHSMEAARDEQQSPTPGLTLEIPEWKHGHSKAKLTAALTECEVCK